MKPREILAKAMYDSLDRLTPWAEVDQERDYWLRLADAAMAVSKAFNDAIWQEGFEAGRYYERVEG